MSLLDKITALQSVNTLSKHEHLVNGITEAIDAKILSKGDQLPSINVMVKELGYARKTIVKAYEELKSRGIVESKQFKGYYILSEETHLKMKVALLLYAFHSFQETFYNTFRDHLGDNVQMDVFFHHNNPELFETILSNIEKRYGMYVIAPIQSPTVSARLKDFPPEKLLLVDRYLPLGPEYSYIAQEFEQNTFEKLGRLLPQIQKYEHLMLLFREDADYPEGIRKGFVKFLEKHGVEGSIREAYEVGTLQKGYAYLFISDNNLFLLVRDCLKENFTIGEDVGIISCNESLTKEIIASGLTTMSTDFVEMARKAAEFVNTRKPIQEIIPTRLIKRKSL
ncbi:MAG: substrate-binding domain-containing protein [Bacteroidota bacterium]